MTRPLNEGFVRRTEAKRREAKKGADQVAKAIGGVGKAVKPKAKNVPAPKASPAPFPKAQSRGTVKRQQTRRSDFTGKDRAFYGSRSAAERKALRESTGVLAPKTQAAYRDLNQKRIRAAVALEALAAFSHEHAKNQNAQPSDAAVMGAVVAKRRMDRTGKSAEEVLAPFAIRGTSGSGKAATKNTGIMKAVEDSTKAVGKVVKEGGKLAQKWVDAEAEHGTASGRALPRTEGGHRVNLAKEVVGEGDAMKALKEAGDWIGKKAGGKIAVNQPGVKSSGLNEFNLSKAGENAVSKIVTLPGTAVTSLTVPASQALKGDVEGAANSVVGGYKALIEDPLGTFNNDPLGTILMAYGVKAGVGRGTGAVMRSGVAGPKARRAASTRRSPLTAEGIKYVERRAYSPDITTKAVQVAKERSGKKRAVKLREEAARVESALKRGTAKPHETFEYAAAQRANAREAETAQLKDVHFKKAVAIQQGGIERQRRMVRQQVNSDVKKAIGKDHVATAAAVVAQNLAKPTREGIQRFRDHVADVRRELVAQGAKADLKLNGQLLDDLDRTLRDFDRGKLDAGKVEVAAARYSEVTRPLEEAAIESGLINRDQATMAKWMPYARLHMNARHDGDRLVIDTPDGPRPLTVSAIEAHAKANDLVGGPGTVNPPAWVSHARTKRGFNEQAGRGESRVPTGRTGESVARGTIDTSMANLSRSANLTAGMVHATRSFRTMLDEFVVRRPDGQLDSHGTARDANRAAAEYSARPGNPDVVAIRKTPWSASAEQRAASLDALSDTAANEGLATSIKGALEEGINGTQRDGGGEYVLIPRAAAKEMLQQVDSGASPWGPVGDVAFNLFRRTVLPFSTKWMANNITEGMLRAAVAGAGPGSYRIGRKAFKAAMDENPQAGAMAQAILAPGGAASFARTATVRREAADFNGALGALARQLHRAHESKSLGWVPATFMTVTDVIFTGMGMVEGGFQTAMLGKAIRQEAKRDGGIGPLGAKAIEEAGKGLTNTSTQVAFAKRIDDMYGKYSGYTASSKRAFNTLFPFAPWWISAVNFCFRVLPRDHPVMVGLIASTEQATKEWRIENGLEPYIGLFHAMDGALPAWQQGTVPSGAGLRNVTQGTPFDVATDPLASMGTMLLPQAMGIVNAFRGLDWKGSRLKGPDGGAADDNTLLRAAGNSLIEQSSGPYGVVKRITEGDGGLDKLNPYRAINKTGKVARKVKPGSAPPPPKAVGGVPRVPPPPK